MTSGHLEEGACLCGDVPSFAENRSACALVRPVYGALACSSSRHVGKASCRRPRRTTSGGYSALGGKDGQRRRGPAGPRHSGRSETVVLAHHLGGAFADDGAGSLGVAGGDPRHDRAVGHPQPADAVDPQRRVHDRQVVPAHLRGTCLLYTSPSPRD